MKSDSRFDELLIDPKLKTTSNQKCRKQSQSSTKQIVFHSKSRCPPTPSEESALTSPISMHPNNFDDEQVVNSRLLSEWDSLKNSIRKKDQELFELNSKLRKAFRYAKSSKCKQEIIENELQLNKNQVESLNNEIDSKNEIISHLTSEIESLHVINLNCHTELKNLTRVYHKLEIDFSNQISKFKKNQQNDGNQHLLNQITELTRTNSNLLQQINNLILENAHYKQEIHSMQSHQKRDTSSMNVSIDTQLKELRNHQNQNEQSTFVSDTILHEMRHFNQNDKTDSQSSESLIREVKSLNNENMVISDHELISSDSTFKDDSILYSIKNNVKNDLSNNEPNVQLSHQHQTYSEHYSSGFEIENNSNSNNNQSTKTSDFINQSNNNFKNTEMIPREKELTNQNDSIVQSINIELPKNDLDDNSNVIDKDDFSEDLLPSDAFDEEEDIISSHSQNQNNFKINMNCSYDSDLVQNQPISSEKKSKSLKNDVNNSIKENLTEISTKNDQKSIESNNSHQQNNSFDSDFADSNSDSAPNEDINNQAQSLEKESKDSYSFYSSKDKKSITKQSKSPGSSDSKQNAQSSEQSNPKQEESNEYNSGPKMSNCDSDPLLSKEFYETKDLSRKITLLINRNEFLEMQNDILAGKIIDLQDQLQSLTKQQIHNELDELTILQQKGNELFGPKLNEEVKDLNQSPMNSHQNTVHQNEKSPHEEVENEKSPRNNINQNEELISNDIKRNLEMKEDMKRVINTIRNASFDSSNSNSDENDDPTFSVAEFSLMKQENSELKEILNRFDLPKNDNADSVDQLKCKIKSLESFVAQLAQKIESMSRNEAELTQQYESESLHLQQQIRILETEVERSIASEVESKFMIKKLTDLLHQTNEGQHEINQNHIDGIQLVFKEFNEHMIQMQNLIKEIREKEQIIATNQSNDKDQLIASQAAEIEKMAMMVWELLEDTRTMKAKIDGAIQSFDSSEQNWFTSYNKLKQENETLKAQLEMCQSKLASPNHEEEDI